MKTIAINGSPRKNWNTAVLLENALKGASGAGSQTELGHLYDIDFKGCISCFKCKIQGGKNYGKCAAKDGLTPFLEKIEKSDALILGTPIYMGAITGEMKSFMERLLFQHHLYTNPPQSSYKGNIKVGLIFDMGMDRERFENSPLKIHTEAMKDIVKRIFGNVETLYIFDTYQMDDYKNIDYWMDIDKKRERRKTVFPKDCEKAFELGMKLISK